MERSGLEASVKGFEVDLGKRGLSALLNDAERDILEVLWRRGDETLVKDIHSEVGKKHSLSHVTICIYLDRLYERGLVDRRPVTGKGGLKYLYFSSLNRRELGERVARRLALILRQAFGSATANYFMKEARKGE